MVKNLEVKILKTIDLGPRRWGWLRSVWLVHDRAIVGVKARLDVTWGLWKTLKWVGVAAGNLSACLMVGARQSQNLKRLRASSPTLWNSQRVGQPQSGLMEGWASPRVISNVEIVVPLLPEMIRVANQTPRYSLLQRLQSIGHDFARCGENALVPMAW